MARPEPPASEAVYVTGTLREVMAVGEVACEVGVAVSTVVVVSALAGAASTLPAASVATV